MSDRVQIEISMTSYQRVREVLARVASDRTYRGAFRDTITAMLDIAKNYAQSVTHVYTGMLQASHVTEYDGHRMRGRVYVDDQVLARDVSGRLKVPYQLVAEYAAYEHSLGGSHAFYERTMKHTGVILQMRGMRTLLTTLDSQVRAGDILSAFTS